MSRHRIVRSMNYSDEYDGYDDVYGHSVEEDFSISPSDAEQFIFDRNKPTRLSLFRDEDQFIPEEDENLESEENCRKSSDFKWPELNPTDEVRLRSCLEEIRNVIGDAFSEATIIETILKNDFDFAKSLDTILTNSKDAKQVHHKTPPEINGVKPFSNTVDKRVNDKTFFKKISQESSQNGNILEPTSSNNVRIVPATNTGTTKGFDLINEKSQENSKTGSNTSTPRTQSPSNLEIDSTTENGKKLNTMGKSKPRTRDLKTDPVKQYETERANGKDHMNMVVIGHVDAGKSTLMGHLLYLVGQVNKKTMHKYEQESKKLGKQSFMYAWILDETREERSRGITIDVAQSKFETVTKTVTLLDAPGHKDFIPNMITGATQADVALLVTDATRGEFETGFESGGQTREHALLARSLGVNQLAVVINKLDTVDWSQDRFLEIRSKLGKFLKSAGFRESDVTYIPCSGLTGQNLVTAPTENGLLKWYKGPCLLEVIDKFKAPERAISKPFRMSINDIFKGTSSSFWVSGRVETGMVQVGDKILVQPLNEIATIKALSIDDRPVQMSFAGDQVSAALNGIVIQNVSIGYVLCDLSQPITVSTKFEARIVVFNLTVPITLGHTVVLHSQSITEPAVITKLVAQLDKSSGEITKKRPRFLLKNSSAIIEITTSKPICMELYKDFKELGRFMIRTGGVTIAAGLVTKIFKESSK